MMTTNETLFDESKSFKILFEEFPKRIEDLYDQVKLL